MNLEVITKIEKVTVYPDRAKVTCIGNYEAQAGLHQLQIDQLPLLLDSDSVRATGRGTGRVRLLGVDVVRRNYEQTPTTKVRELEEAIEQVQAELRVLNDQQATWQAQAKHLDGLRQETAAFAKGLAKGETTVANQLQLLQFLQEQDEGVRAQLREVGQQQAVLNRRLQKLKKDLEGLRTIRPTQKFQAQVEVDVLEAGEFELTLTYMVRNAGWKPLYDLRLDENGRLLTLSYIAQITQRSGQDWDDVALTVSTARPALNQRIPKLNPWYIDEFVPPPPPQPRQRMVRAMPTAMADDAPQAEMAFAAKSVAAEVAVAEVEETGTAVTFHVGGTTNVQSSGSPHKTTMVELQLSAEVDYLAVPKHTDAVFRRAKVQNDSPTPLLAGAANLFVGEEFIGKTQLKYTPTGGELELLLGVEERITVSRELAKRDVDKRFLRDNRQLRYGYKMALENLLEAAVRVVVQDQIPVSRHEEIKVNLDKVSPQAHEQSELNMLEWRLTLPGQSKKEIMYEYMVEHPRSVKVAGLRD
ncbi:MAG: mucoidy inhibitor MuiA family protein [Chloroflexota bacterium]